MLFCQLCIIKYSVRAWPRIHEKLNIGVTFAYICIFLIRSTYLLLVAQYVVLLWAGLTLWHCMLCYWRLKLLCQASMYCVITVFVVHISMPIIKITNYFVKNVKCSIGLEKKSIKATTSICLIPQLSAVDFITTGRLHSIPYSAQQVTSLCSQ